jgi:hypothetical protein
LGWVRDLSVLSAFESAELTVADDDDLTEIWNTRRLKLKHSSTDMPSFWLSLWQEYPIIIKKVTEAFLPFSTLYLCYEQVTASNTGESFRLCLATIWPQTRDIMRHHHV